MYRFFLLAILFSLTMPAFAQRTFTTITPYNTQAYYGGDYIPHRRYSNNRSVFSDINELEKYAMNKNFTKDSDRIRLERLETLAFGAVQEGDIYTRYENVRNSILSRPKNNYKTSVLRNISNYFNGQLTGFTPQINNSYTSNPTTVYPAPTGFEQSSYTQYHSPWRNGYKMYNYGMGTGSGVHILD